MSDLTHVEQTVDSSFGLFFLRQLLSNSEYCQFKVFGKVHCGETDEKQNPGQRAGLSAFFLLLS